MKSTLKAFGVGLALIGLILLSISFQGCAMFNKTLTLTIDNAELNIEIPSEFSELQTEDFERDTIFGYQFLFRLSAFQEDMIYGIIFQISNPKPIAFFMHNYSVPIKWWIYNKENKLVSVSREEFIIETEQYDYLIEDSSKNSI